MNTEKNENEVVSVYINDLTKFVADYNKLLLSSPEYMRAFFKLTVDNLENSRKYFK